MTLRKIVRKNPAAASAAAACRSMIVAAAVGMAMSGLTGCAALPLASLGTLSGIAFSAVSTGKDVYQLGKLDSAEMTTMEQALQAGRDAGEELDLRLKVDTREGAVGQLKFVDEKSASLAVRVERRTPMLVRTRIDVGWFGSEVTARLFLNRMRQHLPQASTRPSEDQVTHAQRE